MQIRPLNPNETHCFVRDGLVDEYVLYYLRGLSTVAERIPFVSDSPLDTVETTKLSGLAEVVSATRRDEHGFGSSDIQRRRVRVSAVPSGRLTGSQIVSAQFR